MLFVGILMTGDPILQPFIMVGDLGDLGDFQLLKLIIFALLGTFIPVLIRETD
jgi:hypothetical protein